MWVLCVSGWRESSKDTKCLERNPSKKQKRGFKGGQEEEKSLGIGTQIQGKCGGALEEDQTNREQKLVETRILDTSHRKESRMVNGMAVD